MLGFPARRELHFVQNIFQLGLVYDETDSFTWGILAAISALVDFSRIEHRDVAGLHAFGIAAPVKVHFSAEADDHIILRMSVWQAIVVFSKVLKVVHARPQIWSQPELTKPLP